MDAVNLLDGRAHEVKRFKNVMYYETESKTLPYYILEFSFDNRKKIDPGHLYTYYDIDGDLYSGYLTNSFKAFVKQNEQLQLFEVL